MHVRYDDGGAIISKCNKKPLKWRLGCFLLCYNLLLIHRSVQADTNIDYTANNNNNPCHNLATLSYSDNVASSIPKYAAPPAAATADMASQLLNGCATRVDHKYSFRDRIRTAGGGGGVDDLGYRCRLDNINVARSRDALLERLFSKKINSTAFRLRRLLVEKSPSGPFSGPNPGGNVLNPP